MVPSLPNSCRAAGDLGLAATAVLAALPLREMRGCGCFDCRGAGLRAGETGAHVFTTVLGAVVDALVTLMEPTAFSRVAVAPMLAAEVTLGPETLAALVVFIADSLVVDTTGATDFGMRSDNSISESLTRALMI